MTTELLSSGATREPPLYEADKGIGDQAEYRIHGQAHDDYVALEELLSPDDEVSDAIRGIDLLGKDQ
jgi:hypothetical protein